ncbi:MAG: hypothetical protein AAFU85_02825 [Planctomycetota bacterium]
MTIIGTNMHRQLLDGYKQAQHALDQARIGINVIEARRGELDEDRSRALLDLAKHYLPDLSNESIEKSWIEVRGRVSRILLRRDEEREQLEDSCGGAGDKLHLLEDRLFEVNESLDETQGEQDRLSKLAESKLTSDETFVQLSSQAAKAEAALERAESNLDEIEQDAAKKLPAYRKSSLFTYLRDRNFGTGQYPKRGITRRMDRWVAKLIGYRKAKQSYDFLSGTPDRMRKIIASDRESLYTVMDELEGRRDAIAKETGLTEAITACEQLVNQRDGLLDELHVAQQEVDKLEAELTDLEDPHGRYYQEAVAAFRDMLAEFRTEELERRAGKTASLSDDQIVAKIVGVDESLDDLETDTRRHHDDLMDRQEAINSLGQMIQRFRAAKFDSARSEFLPSVDVIGSIGRARSSHDIEELWHQLRKAQRWAPSLGDKVASVAAHPATQLLVSAMAQAAGAAMSNHARRAGRRRYRQDRFPKIFDSSSDHRRKRW